MAVLDRGGRRGPRGWPPLLGGPARRAGVGLREDYVEFDLGEGRTFEVLGRSAAPEYDRPRFQVGFTVEDIDAAREELLRRGVESVTEIVRGGVSAWAYFRDPEGNVFEITERFSRG